MNSPRKCRSFYGTDGFTLLEVLVALALVAITVIGVFSLQLQNLRLADSSRFDTEAILAVNTAIAAVTSRPLDQLTHRGPSTIDGTIRGSTKWSATVKQWPEITGDEPSMGLYRIEVTVRDEASKQEFTLVTYRMAGVN